MTGDFEIGSPVIVSAADDFYQFIDGWHGNVIGNELGLIKIECISKENVRLEFIVPADQLEHRKQ